MSALEILQGQIERIRILRQNFQQTLKTTRNTSLATTKLQEAEHWLEAELKDYHKELASLHVAEHWLEAELKDYHKELASLHV